MLGLQPVTASHPKHLHHLIAQVIDHLHGDPARLRLPERSRSVALERRPRFLVDLGLERCLQCLVRIVRSQEVGVPNEEALRVVVRVDEPASKPVRKIARSAARIALQAQVLRSSLVGVKLGGGSARRLGGQ